MAEEEKDTPSMDQVTGFIQTQVKSYLDTWVQNEGNRSNQLNQPSQFNQDQNQKALADVLNPFIDPKISQSNLRSADAKDFASFYMDNPEAHQMKPQIEKMFDDLVTKGQPHTREDIYDKIVGSSYRTNKDDFYTKETERRQAQVNAVRSAQDFGSGGLGREHNPDLEQKFANIDKLTSQEQAELLADVVW